LVALACGPAVTGGDPVRDAAERDGCHRQQHADCQVSRRLSIAQRIRPARKGGRSRTRKEPSFGADLLLPARGRQADLQG
jgi:hypothetical protein